MFPVIFLALGFFAITFNSGSQAQQTFQFSSFSQIPQALLKQLPPSQVENLKKQFGIMGGGSPQSPSGSGSSQISSGSDSSTQTSSGSDSSTQSPSDGSPGAQTFQFSSFSQIPQTLLDQLPESEVERLRKEFQHQTPKGKTPSGSSSSGGSPGAQTFQFSSFSQIPQSLLDKLPKSQVESLRKQFQTQEESSTSSSSNSESSTSSTSNEESSTSSASEEESSTSFGIPTFQIGGGSPGRSPMAGQTLQFSKFSDIPKSVLDRLSSAQRENIRKLLSQKSKPRPVQPVKQPPPKQQTFEFSSFSQIPESVLDQFSSSQINQIKQTLQKPQNTVQLPAGPSQFSFRIPGGNNTEINGLLDIAFNYVAVGGFLTGVPPIDLLLLRYYVAMGPQNFC